MGAQLSNHPDFDCSYEFTTIRLKPTQLIYKFDFDEVPERISIWLINRTGEQVQGFAEDLVEWQNASQLSTTCRNKTRLSTTSDYTDCPVMFTYYEIRRPT